MPTVTLEITNKEDVKKLEKVLITYDSFEDRDEVIDVLRIANYKNALFDMHNFLRNRLKYKVVAPKKCKDLSSEEKAWVSAGMAEAFEEVQSFFFEQIREEKLDIF